MNKMFRIACLAISLVPLLTGCDHKELCFDHWEHAERCRLAINASYQQEWEYTYPGAVDWQKIWDKQGFDISYDLLRPAIPEGLRCLAYPDGQPFITFNIPAKGGIVELPEGKQQLLLFNNDTEFIHFEGMRASLEAKATTSTKSRSTYFNNSKVNLGSEKTVSMPDMLYGKYIPEYEAHRSPAPEQLDVEMKPLVFKYYVRYEFREGLEFVALARGALAGMAESVFLTDGHTGSETATVLYDCSLTPWGVEATVLSFGAPDYPNPEYSRAEHIYGLNLEVRLKNGKVVSFDWDISSQMESQPRGGVIAVDDIIISEEMGEADSGVFDVDIDDWGEYQDIPLNF